MTALSDQEKKRKARQILKRKIATLDDEIKRSIAKSRYTQMKQKRIKTRQKALMIVGGLAVFVFLIYLVLRPGHGNMAYGLCKVFIETQVEYPVTLRYTSGRIFKEKIRIEYAHQDSFGQNQLETMDCFIKRDEQGQYYLDKAEKNRGEIDPRTLESFNKSIPAILAYPPDLSYPQGLPNELKAYKR